MWRVSSPNGSGKESRKVCLELNSQIGFHNGLFKGCLVHPLKHAFSVFKQHYTHFHTIFDSCIFTHVFKHMYKHPSFRIKTIFCLGIIIKASCCGILGSVLC